MKTSTTAVAHDHERDYGALLDAARRSFERVTEGETRLFLTDAKDLFATYLSNIPLAERQVHNCSACRRFVDTYGGVVVIAEDGLTWPVMWDPEGVPDFYADAFRALQKAVKRARVISTFLTKAATWGQPQTGEWVHLAVTPPTVLVYREGALSAGQAMAASRESCKTVLRALGDFKAPMLDQALRLFEGEHLARSEKFVGPTRWLRDLQDRPKGRAGENLVWRAIGSAPEGYCHPRSSVIGPLLEDIEAGMAFEDVKRRFDAKLGPLQYQRPQAAPTAGNLKAAEDLFERLGLAPALERRFARFDELELLWRPEVSEASKGKGVFGHITPKDMEPGPAMSVPAARMTWDKFSRIVLPNARDLRLMVPARGAFIALTSAAHASAPAILKWDDAHHSGERNPVAWYVYPGGSGADQWGLKAAWTRVTGATLFPNQWGPKPQSFLADGVILVLEGAVDSHTSSGNALFPECLKAELHGVRAVVEAYSKRATLSAREPGACGYDLRRGHASCRLSALVKGVWDEYQIDRWD